MSGQTSLPLDDSMFYKIKNYLSVADEKYNVPDYITSNLKHDFWYWQREAMQYFYVFKRRRHKFVADLNQPTHLMFNMATGTGKTMLMAAFILEYYKQDYRHFIFFVNQNNIVDKTENNFINKHHTKYEFRHNIIIDDKTINIRKVETFDDTDDIQIKFTSIHKLHNAVYLARENAVTLGELQKRDLVMIGDEAHHLNAATMKSGQVEIKLSAELKQNASEKDVEKSWEDTVINKILRKVNIEQQKDNKNVLLEFTATIPQRADVREKYRSKTIYKFELVDFLKAGYTKEINLISTSLENKEKILLAMLFNWYRHQIALKNNIANFKPVILFRSKVIEASRSDYAKFISLIADLGPTDFGFLTNIENSIKRDQASFKVYEQGKSRVRQMLAFIKDEGINIRDIVNYLKDEFAQKNCIITNSKDNRATTKEKTTDEQDQLLNSLEDKNNHIRAIFTVKRLTEGWDVLNLFDIVRLYKGRDEGKGKAGRRKVGSTTVQEIQLIGRGVRYFPFDYKQYERSKRKFDNDLENPLRVLEEFYYHSNDPDHRYLYELKRELKNKGFIDDDRVIKKFALKDDFKQSQFFKEIKVWKNEREDNPHKRKLTLSKLEKEFVFEYKLNEFVLKEEQVVLDKDTDETIFESFKRDRETHIKKFSDFEKHIVAKAINKKAKKDLSLLRFDNLQSELDIGSVDDIFKQEFIGNFEIKIITTKNNFNDITNEQKLDLLLNFFEKFMQKLREIANPHKGTEEFKPFSFNDLFGEEKEKSVIIDEESKSLEEQLLRHSWYVLDGFNGTSEERELLDFMQNRIINLEQKYDKVYLLRNEEVYKIYDFEKGRGFAPDFLLFLQGKQKNLYYQVFIEPKGGQFKDREGLFRQGREGWKEDFLQQITNKYSDGDLLKHENEDYKLIGLPLFNSENNIFEKAFRHYLLK